MAATWADKIFLCNFIFGNVLISTKILLNFVPKGPIDIKPSLYNFLFLDSNFRLALNMNSKLKWHNTYIYG